LWTIVDTKDGLIASWTGTSNTATVAFDNSASGAVYKGLASLNGTFLLATNFNSGKIDVFDRNFNLTSLSGLFTDPKLPCGLRTPRHQRYRKPDRHCICNARCCQARRSARCRYRAGRYLRREWQFREHFCRCGWDTQRALGRSGDPGHFRGNPPVRS